MKKYILFIFLCIIFSACEKDNKSPTSQNYLPLGPGAISPITPPPIYTTLIYNGKLIVGGAAGQGGFIDSGIAEWNGSSWSSLGKGLNGTVNTMIIYNGNLIAGGNFTIAGSTMTNYIAQWNGNSWSGLQGGELQKHYKGYANPAVNAMAIYNGNLIVGGQFDSAGNIYANGLAQWNGSTWSNIGSASNSYEATVDYLVAYNGNLIEVGSGSIKSWNGTVWDSLTSYPSQILAMTVYNGNIIICRWDGVYQWNNNNWSTLGSLEYGTAATIFQGNLFVGTNAGYSNSENAQVYEWNGTSWTSIGQFISTPPYPSVNYIATYNGELLAVGFFLLDGVAIYNGSTWTAL